MNNINIKFSLSNTPSPDKNIIKGIKKTIDGTIEMIMNLL